jgi:hypothetical protein
MLNFHAQWRLDFAKHLIKPFRTYNGIQAIVVAGSVARGFADKYSDLEIPIFWDTLPDDFLRHRIVTDLKAKFLYDYDGPSQEDQLLINDLQVDLWHNTVGEEEAVLKAVLQDYSTSLSDSNFIDTIRSCIPLYGQELIQAWKSQAEQYPDELVIRNIREQLVALDPTQLSILAYRYNPTIYYAQVSKLQQKMFLILLALNRAYFPTFKWMYLVLEAMRVKPREVEQRFRRVYHLPQEEVITETTQLLKEIVALVEQYFPHLEMSPIRQRLAYVRQEHIKPVELPNYSAHI